jgi:hypothetical protein
MKTVKRTSPQPRDLDVLLSALDDYRGLIAAGKERRWDVVKWVVSVNLLLATAAIFLKAPASLLLFSILVAAIGAALLIHYNWRMTRARTAIGIYLDEIRKKWIDVRALEGDTRDLKSFWYDWPELLVFTLVILSSLIPAFAVFKGCIGN